MARNACSIVAAPALGHELRRRGVGENLATMEDDYAVGVGHLVAQMRRPEDGDGTLGAQAQHQLEEVAAASRIEADGRFVHEEDARLVQERARELDPAAVAAAQLRGLVVRALGEPEPRQLARDARLGDRARDAVQAGMEQEIAGHRQFEIERRLLKDDAEQAQGRHRIAAHVVAHDLDAAGIGDEQPGKELEEGGLAGAVRAEQGDELAGRRPEADAVDRANRAVGLDDAVEQQRRRAFLAGHAFPGSCLVRHPY